MLASFRVPSRRSARLRVTRPAVDVLESRELTAYAGIGVPSVRPPAEILFPVFRGVTSDLPSSTGGVTIGPRF